jgi:SAM-dependent methyltransferase
MSIAMGTSASLRAALKRVGPLRSLYHLGRTAADVLTTRPSRVAADCEETYRRARDPWAYSSEGQQARLRSALSMIDAAFAGRSDLTVLEIGCGEGAFSALLAARCGRLVATDASPTALERARNGLAGRSNAEFHQLDVLSDPLGSGFDLIVMDHVIDLFGRRAAYRQIAAKIAAALKPEGRALIGAMRAFDLAEEAWWSRWVLSGGVAILGWIGRYTDLLPVATVTESFYTHTLFRRRA